MINVHNMHLNPCPYPTSPRVKFHIQATYDVEGVALCGGIYSPDRYMVFTRSFVERMDATNQCLCCMKAAETV
jgi:hypothetical protein